MRLDYIKQVLEKDWTEKSEYLKVNKENGEQFFTSMIMLVNE